MHLIKFFKIQKQSSIIKNIISRIFGTVYQEKTDEEIINLIKKQDESSSQTVCDLSDDENQQENDEDEHDEEMTNQQALKMIIQIRKHLSKSKHNFESAIDSLGSI
ncbi:hypothetical protein BpHYR1_016142 [Brachionus plicatilis]|uniref:Uncharacterized protein n=1 Tax=Brachionus plicatilis TaxID=10195 RepID=A0A3M7RP54_BRAPC|nr:hypothetical protein BpHYR1_016142 [Brachionus plicatilis]